MRGAAKAALSSPTATRVSGTTTEWNKAGNCLNPQSVWLEGAPPGANGARVYDRTVHRRGPQYVALKTRCRKCTNCLVVRQLHWRDRAIAETTRSSRTWFGTLTLRPEEHYKVLAEAIKLSRLSQTEFAALSSDQQFSYRCKVIYRHVQRWLKRVRKVAGVPLRYLCVAEAHKSGLPHLHVLIHETGAGQTVRKKVLQDQWLLGFSAMKLADPEAASYLCKYLSKSVAARVRASIAYGDNQHTISNHSLCHKKNKRESQRPSQLSSTLEPTHQVGVSGSMGYTVLPEADRKAAGERNGSCIIATPTSGT